MSGSRYALVAGGGTAGHLQPALAIAEALVSSGHPRDGIQLVGSRRAGDQAALQGRGFPVTVLPGRGVARSFRPSLMIQNLVAIAGLSAATVMAFRLVWRHRPQVVVSVGGYASVATATAAVVLGVPLVLVNVDAVPGAANRLFGRFARAAAVGWDGTRLPRAQVTGTPVRPEFARVQRDDDSRRRARTALGIEPDRGTVIVFGGSLGARRINRSAEGLARVWAGRHDRSIFHIVGLRDWDEQRSAAESDRSSGVLMQVAYEERMATAFEAADIVVCRAGAMTVAELSVAGVPAILVPLPGAPGDHQTANALVLERVGGAVLLPDHECEGTRIAALADGLLADRVALDAMGRAAASLGHPDAAAAAARVVEAAALPARIPRAGRP